jgi:hypothetical protein
MSAEEQIQFLQALEENPSHGFFFRNIQLDGMKFSDALTNWVDLSKGKWRNFELVKPKTTSR